MIKKNITPITDIIVRDKSRKKFNNHIVNDDINQLTDTQYSHSTVLAMTTDWNRFVSFCEAKHVNALPASITAIRMFLEYESRERKFASIRRYSITIGTIHKLHSYPVPTAHRQIQFTLSQLRLQKQGDARQANALTTKHLDSLDELLSRENTLRGHRDRAIYYIMFECALKRTNLKNLQLSDVVQIDNQWCVNLNDMTYKLSDKAGSALFDWIQFLTGSQGYLFRRIDKHNNIGMYQLDDSSIYRILRRASDLLGLANHYRFTGQSARVGATQELERQGYNIRDIQDFGRWLSPAMPAQYLQMKRVAENEMTKYKVIKPWD
ncbi:tyrosine-type recombinase/integrase [Vibrio sp. F74]